MRENLRRSVWLPAILLFFLALIPRLIGLDKVISVDEQLWIERSIAFWRGLVSGDLAATYQSPHPGITTMWTGGLGLLWLYAWQGRGSLGDFMASVTDTVPYWTLLTTMRWPTLLITSASVGGVYVLLRRLGRPSVAFLSGLLLALDPFYLAHSRVLHHDALFTAFATLGLFSWLALLAEDRPRWLPWVSGVAAGLAVLSKLSGGALAVSVPLITVVSLGWQRAPKTVWPHWGKRLAQWGIAAALTVGLLLPALWVSPQKVWEGSLSFAQEAGEESHERGTFFLGRPQPDGGWLFYPVNAAFTLSLGAAVGLALVAWAVVRRQPLGMNRRAVGLAWLAGALFFLVITVGSKKQARYVLPLFPLLDWLAGSGWAWLWLHLRRRSSWAWAWWPALLTAGLAACLMPYYPYYFGYYNPLLGGGQAASQAVLVGRGEGLEDAAAYLNTRPDASHLQVASWYGTTFRPLFAGKTVDVAHLYNLVSSDYVVFYVNQWQRGLPDEASLNYFATQAPEKVISHNGIDYARIYRAPGADHPIRSDARLVGQARLLAFSLGKGDIRLTAIPSNATTQLSLHWLWLGHPATDTIQVSLVDRDGLTWGWGYPQPEVLPPATAWSEGTIVRSDFSLHVFPGTPPGTYYLRAWVDRPATGQTIGVFPLEPAEAAVQVEAAAAQPAVGDLPLSRQTMMELSPGVTLLGYEAGGWDKPWSPGETRQVTLYWCSAMAGSVPRASLTLRLVDTAGDVRARWTDHSLAGLYPTTMWHPGEVVRDPWLLTLPAYVPPGDYHLEAAWSDQAAPPLMTGLRVNGRERSFSLPGDGYQPLALRLGESIYLRGYTLASAADGLHMTLNWQAKALTDTDYTVFVQLLDANGRIVAQKDAYPLAGVAPTSTWAVGEVVVDPYVLSLPQEMGPGPHQLIMGMYRAATGQRLPMFDQADQPVGDHFALDASPYLP